ncbi:MAG: hypothetical protein HKN24_11580 [Acidimicrobiales bacterium]|nr:hypothetical protein [Acidimicrobiales bacterium]
MRVSPTLLVVVLAVVVVSCGSTDLTTPSSVVVADSPSSSSATSAAGLLVNEGYSQAVEDALGDVYGGDVADLLRGFCREALCSVDYAIIDSTTPSLFGAAVTVRFDTWDGPVTTTISVGSFEGRLSIGSLPPTSP